MLHVVSTLFSTGLVVASAHAGLTLSSNGDTALIIVETMLCVLLLSAVVYCKHRHRLAAE